MKALQFWQSIRDDNSNSCYDFKIVGLTIAHHEVGSHSVRVEWALSDISGANLVEYQPSYRIVGEDHWTYNNWTKIPDMGYTFEGLYPYTR